MNMEEEILAAVNGGDIEAVRRFVETGADVNTIRDYAGRTLLYWAAYDGNTEIARLLIQHGADVDAADEYGITPLMEACEGCCVETARLLIESGANVNAMDEGLETVLDNVSSFSQPGIFALLREAGAKTDLEILAEKYAGKV